MANCLWDRWTCHSLSNIEVCANASSNISKHQPARKRLFFSGFGRWSSKARSCKLYKLSNKRLNTDGSGCTVTQSGNAIQDRTTQKTPRTTRKSPIQICVFASQTKAKQQQNGARAQPKQKSPEKTQEKHAGCQYSSMLCFHMYKPRTNSEYASNQTVYNGRNTSSGKALACWFFICTNLKQTLFKPQIYGAGPCQQVRRILKESSINFFFCARQL